jgi:uncharacterized protein
MKLHASAPSGVQVVTAYGADYVTVNGVRYEESIVLLPSRVVEWEGHAFDRLTRDDFAFLGTLDAEIVLLGTGARQRFPHPRLTAPLGERRIGLEVMDLQAACRTYNILVAEGRKVAAALLFA